VSRIGAIRAYAQAEVLADLLTIVASGFAAKSGNAAMRGK
jgi:hypothetical protein